jgi:asparagine synthase (glutamine-hydrolysing)
MCGIAGIAGAGVAGPGIVRTMAAQITHRGPDDEGYYDGPGVALGVRRLSIIDLAGGHQPIVASDGTAIVFNGEIYNYRQLRSELAAAGVPMRTASDTEVVLELFRLEGPAALDRLEGMFAFCVLDPAGRRLHLARDRLGKKPLYWARDRERLLFGSELKALLAGMPRRPQLDRQALHHYLTLRYVPSPGTVWQGVQKLDPGHRLEFALDTGEVSLCRWWSPTFRSEPESVDRDYPLEFERLLLDAVEKRLVAADVPVGVLLSGGLDSSAVSAAAVELGHKAFHTFSVGYRDGGPCDELAWARRAADHVGSRHHEVAIGPAAFRDGLDELVWASDEPLADLASIPLLAVSRLAREHVKVVLSGEGADEVLAGYDMERLAAMLHRLRLLAAVPARVLGLGACVAPAGRGVLAGIATAGVPGYLSAIGAHITHVFDEHEKATLWRDGGELASTDDLIKGWYDATASPEPIDQLQQVYCHSWLVEDLLMKADKMTMAASLELRTPFLDHHLVEWAASAPLTWKVGGRGAGWSSKRILREFAARRLPGEIVSRPKQGFPVPAYDALRGDLGEWAARRLAASGSALRELLDVTSVPAIVSRARAGDRPAAYRVWTLLVLDAWLGRWL